MFYYQFNIGDYHSHTGYLSLMEDLAYRRILDHYYLQELPLPEDPKKVARIIGMREYPAEVGQILEDFFVLENGGWINKRADVEIKSYHAKAEAARANGQKGGRPKKPNPNPAKTQSVNSANPEEPNPNPAETGSKANQEPRTKNHKPITTLKDKDKDKDKPKAKRFSPNISMWEEWGWPCEPDKQIFDSWLAARKKIKAGISELSFKRLGSEFCKASQSINDCLAEMELRSWKGFKSDWMKNTGAINGQHQQNNRPMSAVDKVRAATGLNEQGQYETGSAASELSDGSVVASYDRDLRS